MKKRTIVMMKILWVALLGERLMTNPTRLCWSILTSPWNTRKWEGMSDIAWAICKNRSPMFQARMEPIPVQLKADITVNWLYRHKKRETVARENGINVELVNNIIYEFATIKRTGKKERKAINLLRRKLYGWYSKFLKEFAENNFEKGFTLVNARRALLNEFSDINDISLSSLIYLFRKQLKFIYKKLGLNNLIKARSENKSNFYFELNW